MLESIQTEYSELFELTKSAFQQIKDEIHFDISDAEIAYLTLHFGAFMTPKNPNQATYRILVICPNGIGTGNMIKNEIQHLVPQATEIQNVPLSQYTPNHNFDVVVSTVVLENESKLIIVHPILTDQDRVAILRKCMYNEPQTRIQINDLLTIAKNTFPKTRWMPLRMNYKTIIRTCKFSKFLKMIMDWVYCTTCSYRTFKFARKL